MSVIQSQPSVVGLQETGANSPVGNAVPIAINSLYLQRTTSSPFRQVLWVSTGLTNSDWIVLVASAIRRTNAIGSPNGVITADQAGQLLIDITTDGYGVTTAATVYTSGGGTAWYAV